MSQNQKSNKQPRISQMQTPKTLNRLERFKPTRAQIVSGALIFSAGMLVFAAVPNSFISGTTISSAAVNDNFSALDARITVLEAKLASVTAITDPITGKPTVRFSGVNVQVVNGMESTATANGTGNLIVGYNEADTYSNYHCTIGGALVTDEASCNAVGGTWTNTGFKTGSHYVVTGSQNNYSRWGGLLAGVSNTSNYDYASVSGGQFNTASGNAASVSGGALNIASGIYSSVSGGALNTASAQSASVSGGQSNTASAQSASVSGGPGCNTGTTVNRWIVGQLTGGCSSTLFN